MKTNNLLIRVNESLVVTYWGHLEVSLGNELWASAGLEQLAEAEAETRHTEQ